MTKFKVKAKDTHSNLMVDIIEAESQQELINSMHRRGLTVVDIAAIKTKHKIFSGSKRVKIGELAVFSRQLSTMINAGLPLIEGLRTLQDQMEREGLKNVVTDVVNQVEGGSSFTDAVSRHPRVFGAFFINMVRAGETSGELSEIMLRIADYMESVESLRRKVKMAMIYPAIISVMAFLITLVLFLKVIPVFEGIFADFGAELPLPTKILIAFSAIFRKWFWLITIAIVIGIVLLAQFKKTSRGREIYDRVKLKIPVFGMLFHKVAISRFSKTLGILVKSGVPILTSFEIVKEVSGNKQIENAIELAAMRIREGKNIEEPLRKSGMFPAMAVKMIAVGEKSGRLEEMLEKISSYYDEQVTTMVAGLANLIEPLMIALLGILIGGIVLCMFLPIFRLSAIVGGK